MAEGVIIVGAGGLGREVHDIVRATGRSVCGFLDDLLDAHGSVDEADPDAGEYLVAVGDPQQRMLLVRRLLARGHRFTAVVHPTAVIGSRVVLGVGTVVAPNACLVADSQVGAHSILNVSSLVGHDAVLGDFCVLSPFAAVNGQCRVDARVFLGTHATVGPQLVIGADSKISAGAVVTADVAPGSLMTGNPARGRVVFPAADA